MSSTSGPKRGQQRPVFGSRGGNKRFKTSAAAAASQITFNQDGGSTPNGSSRNTVLESPKSGRLSQSSPEGSKISQSPSTPKRKASRFTTPSSSPSSQIDLSNDIFNLLSPKKKRYEDKMGSSTKSKLTTFSSPSRISTDDGEEDSLELSLPDFVSRPSKLAFASRMAPRKAKEVAEMHSIDDSQATKSPDLHGQLESNNSKNVVFHDKKQHEFDDIDIFSLESSSLRSNSRNESQNTDLNLVLEEEEKSAEKTDWKNLEEMEEEEGDLAQNSIRSIVNLRSSGTSMRSTEEIDDLLQGLKATNRLGARKVTCLEIVKLLMGAAEEENEGMDVTLSDEWKPPPANSTPFFLSVRRSNMISTLLQAMIKAGAGRGEDVLMDTCLALAYSRFMEGSSLNADICLNYNFAQSFQGILNARYEGQTFNSKRERNFAILQMFALKSGTCAFTLTKMLPSMIMLHVIINFLSPPPDADESRSSSSLQAMEFARLLRGSLWEYLYKAQEFLSYDEKESKKDPEELLCYCSWVQKSCLALSLLYEKYSSIDSIGEKEALSLSQVLDRFALQIGTETQDLTNASAESLSSLLRFMVTSIHQDKAHACQVYLSASGKIVTKLVFVIIQSTKLAQKEVDEDGLMNVRLLDLAALGLSILTDFLQKESKKTIGQLWNENTAPMLERGAIAELSALYWQVVKEKDEHSMMFSGCIAFFLSLLLLSGKSVDGVGEGESLCESSEFINQTQIQAKIIEGMKSATEEQTIEDEKMFYSSLAMSLDQLEDSTSSAKIYKDDHTAPPPKSQNEGIPDEELIIRQLSDRIRREFCKNHQGD